jgi:hypothetical protein
VLKSLDFADFVNYFSFRPDGLVQAVRDRRSNPRSERKPIVRCVRGFACTQGNAP